MRPTLSDSPAIRLQDTPLIAASRASLLLLALLTLIFPAFAQTQPAQKSAADAICGPPFSRQFSKQSLPVITMHHARILVGRADVPVTGLTKYVDALPMPAVAIPSSTNAGVPRYEIVMTNLMHQFHRDLPPVQVWGYGGTYPGPTFDIATNAPIQVDWINQLPDQYPGWLAAITINDGVTNQDVRAVVHLHGSVTTPESDGFPMAWYRPGQARLYSYPDIGKDEGATLWYHDHAMGVTENNVYAGLAGFYIVRNRSLEQALKLPSGAYEIPLLLQDRDIQTNSSPPTILFSGFPWHSLGVVNGKVWPYLNVEPRRYRFRLLNGTTARGLNLGLSSGQPFIQIGTDSGFLPAPVQLPHLRLGAAERADIILDFTAYAGHTNIVMTNDFDVPVPPNTLFEMMQFRVATNASSPDTSAIPAVLSTNLVTAAALSRESVMDRVITLDLCFNDDSGTNCQFLGGPFSTNANVDGLLNLSYFEDPATETPHLGDVEIWSFVNLSPDFHPMHIHLIDFLVLDRIPMPPNQVNRYIADRRLGQLQPLASYLDLSKRTPPDPNEIGFKDTVFVPGFTVARVAMRWQGFTGQYVYHCHLLDHEDNVMMRPIQVLPANSPLTQPPGWLSLRYLDPLGQQLFLELSTSNGRPYRLQSSANLSTWQTLTSFSGSGLPLYFSAPYSNAPGQSFYRATTP